MTLSVLLKSSANLRPNNSHDKGPLLQEYIPPEGVLRPNLHSSLASLRYALLPTHSNLK